jgi:hypothetical protein
MENLIWDEVPDLTKKQKARQNNIASQQPNTTRAQWKARTALEQVAKGMQHTLYTERKTIKERKSSQGEKRDTLGCSERTRMCVALHLFNSFIMHRSSSPLTRQLLLMAKSKKKSSILRSIEGDFKLQTSRQVSLRILKAQFHNLSPVHSDHDSSS